MPQRFADGERSLTSHLWLLLGFLVMLVGVQARAQGYVGAERCRECHAFEYDVWATGPHARAHKALTPTELADPKCNSCHTSHSSSQASSQGGQNDVKLVGVECERCHGPGRYYQADYVMRDRELARAVGLLDVDEVSCVRCHDAGAPSIIPFDFDSMWARISHDKQARAAAAAAARRKKAEVRAALPARR